MVKKYHIIDLETFELSGETVMLDLDDDFRCSRIVIDAELGKSIAPMLKLNHSRDIMAVQRANVDAGVFPKGEHPDRYVR